MDHMRIISISIDTKAVTSKGPWFWYIELNLDGGWTPTLSSETLNRPFKLKEDAIKDAADFIKLNFKEVKVHYPE